MALIKATLLERVAKPILAVNDGCVRVVAIIDPAYPYATELSEMKNITAML
jgi:hypothetical protein